MEARLTFHKDPPADLPESIQVRGDIVVGLYVTRLPENLKISGTLLLNSYQIQELSHGLIVGRISIICARSLWKIPNDLQVLNEIILFSSTTPLKPYSFPERLRHLIKEIKPR